ncbi:MAG: hypothetical protein MUF31_01370 [Akkermansiaceae bacterium]|jgi:hypothetical protein|nr:hypothetical protein [Akkermansiaceae bacterium]
MENPYVSSSVNPVGYGSSLNIDPSCLEALRGTRPWVRFCSVIGFIGSGFMILGAVFMVLSTVFASSMASSSGSSVGTAALMVPLALIYVVFALLYIYPSLKLWQYGTHISTLLASGSMIDLAAALHCQRAFWKFVGIMIATIIGLYIVGIAVFVVITMVGLSSIG